MENSTHTRQSILYGTDREIDLNLQWMTAHSIHLYQGRKSLYESLHSFSEKRKNEISEWKKVQNLTSSATKAQAALPRPSRDKIILSLCLVLSDRTRNNGHKTKSRRCHLNTRKSTARVTKHCHRLSKEAVESASPEIFKSHLHLVLGSPL